MFIFGFPSRSCVRNLHPLQRRLYSRVFENGTEPRTSGMDSFWPGCMLALSKAVRDRHDSQEPASRTQIVVFAPASQRINLILTSERPMSVVMALVFLPWIAVVFFTAGSWAALNLFAYSVVVLAAGYSVVKAALPAATSEAILLVTAAGILAISALSAFWLRLGLPLAWVPLLWLALSAPGALGFWRDRGVWARGAVTYGLSLVLLSALICALYFLPSASNDLVQRRDGSFNWIAWDTQHFHAMAASIKNGGSPPKTPGTDTAELLYHFGPFAPAAAISRFDGLDLGDAEARVTRGASLWALVLSCFSLGTLLSIEATGKKFGGIMSVAGLFFYGSLLSAFNDVFANSGHPIRAVLFKITDGQMVPDGGPFIQIVGGHSLLHGLGAITAIMGLCLIERERESPLSWRGILLLPLPAFAVPVNSVAALYCLGVVGILLFWGRPRAKSLWLPIILMGCFFLGAWMIMGYGHAPDAVSAIIKEHISWQWWTLVVWFVAGLGFRIVGFRWVARPLKDPLSALVLASALGLLGFSVVLQLRDYNERYGIYFLQSIFSIFAFSRVTSGSWRGVERSRVIAEWLRLARKGLILLGSCGVLMGMVAFATHSNTGIQAFRSKIFMVFLLLALLVGISALMKRSQRFSTIGSAVLMGALMVGFLAWTSVWFRYTKEGDKPSITYTPGEVHGLRRLGQLMAPDERFATNKHSLDRGNLLPLIERSYGYSALSERRVLLEGYLDRGETFLPWFDTLLRDNDSLFTTTDPETLRNVARTWRVRWLVARPDTDISLPRPFPSWLVEQQDSGNLKIYRID